MRFAMLKSIDTKQVSYVSSFPQFVGGNLTVYFGRCPTATFVHDENKVKINTLLIESLIF